VWNGPDFAGLRDIGQMALATWMTYIGLCFPTVAETSKNHDTKSGRAGRPVAQWDIPSVRNRWTEENMDNDVLRRCTIFSPKMHSFEASTSIDSNTGQWNRQDNLKPSLSECAPITFCCSIDIMVTGRNIISLVAL
jgi:hypothetical protein